MSKHLIRTSFVVLLAMAAAPSFAAPMPSKTRANQSLDSRQADLAVAQDVVADQQIAQALAGHGLTPGQVNARIERLSPQPLHQLARNLDQVQAAGLTRQEWLRIGVGTLAAIIIVALS